MMITGAGGGGAGIDFDAATTGFFTGFAIATFFGGVFFATTGFSADGQQLHSQHLAFAVCSRAAVLASS